MWSVRGQLVAKQPDPNPVSAEAGLAPPLVQVVDMQICKHSLICVVSFCRPVAWPFCISHCVYSFVGLFYDMYGRVAVYSKVLLYSVMRSTTPVAPVSVEAEKVRVDDNA